jgi:hypothetical protein
VDARGMPGTGDLQDPNVLGAMGPSGSELAYAGRGAVAGIPGQFGDLEQTGREVINALGGNVSPKPFLPTTKKVSGWMPGKAPKPGSDEEKWQEAGSTGSGILAGALGTLGRAATAGGRTARLVGQVEEGQIGRRLLQPAREAVQARRDLGEQLYAPAMQRANALQATAPFQEHPAGRSLLTAIRDRIDTGRVTGETAATRADLRAVLRDLVGEPRPGGGTAYSEPSVIRETLRELRDQAAGLPETRFAAIDQQRAGDLADDIAHAWQQWEPSLAQADQDYRQATQNLYRPNVLPAEGGGFTQELRDAEEAINNLETSTEGGGLGRHNRRAIERIRATINRPSITRLADPETLTRLNNQLDAIEDARAHGKHIRAGVGVGLSGALGLGIGHKFGLF